jgi:hypothetical protein
VNPFLIQILFAANYTNLPAGRRVALKNTIKYKSIDCVPFYYIGINASLFLPPSGLCEKAKEIRI